MEDSSSALPPSPASSPVAYPPVPRVRESEPAWGFWATLGWLLLSAVVTLAVSVACGVFVGGVVGVASAVRGLPFEPTFQRYEGLLVVVVGCLGTAAAVAMLAVPIRLRRRGFAEYLALRSFDPRQGAIALLSVGVLLAAEMVTSFLLDLPIPDSMIELRGGVIFLPLLWLYVVVAAPLGEEIIFRGFLFRGVAESRAGVAAAVVLASLLWTALHIQYGPYELSWIFVLGLVLGWVRHRSGSTTLCVVLHLLFNASAMIALEIMWTGG